MSADLWVAIGCDCDHDRARFDRSLAPGAVSWRGFLGLLDAFNEVRADVEARTGRVPVLTLFVRADRHVEVTGGSLDHCFRLYDEHLAASAGPGDELAWHHHHWRRVEGRWQQESEDLAWMVDNVRASHAALAGRAVRSLHAGWHFQNAATLNAYQEVGIEVDCSALPGMAVGAGAVNRYDHSRVVPHRPYCPARDDHQRPAADPGERRILEVPTTTVRHRGVAALAAINNLAKTGRRPPRAGRTFVQINAHPSLFGAYLSALLAEPGPVPYLCTHFHCDETLPDDGKAPLPRWLYARRHFATNLVALVEQARRRGREVRFTSLGGLAGRLDPRAGAPDGSRAA